MNTAHRQAAAPCPFPHTAPTTMMPTMAWRLHTCAAAVALWLSACGGGADGPDQMAGVSSGGTGSVGGGKPTLVVGRVSAMGLIVNDVHVDTDASTVVTDTSDQAHPTAVSLSSLLPGTNVVVDGGTTVKQSDGMHSVAKTIALHGLLLGAVQSVNTTARSLQIMDHTVALHPQTQIDPTWVNGLASIQPGDTVEVYGWQDTAQQRYVATRLAKRDAATPPRLTGTLAALDLTLGQCQVGTQQIKFAWPKDSALVNGQWVVGGLYPLPPNAQGQWQALTMDLVQPLATDRAQISVDGLINRIQANGLVDVQGWPVQLPAQGCTACTGLQLGDHVRVVGALQAGTVLATELVRQP